jgi:hypothetical protein
MGQHTPSQGDIPLWKQVVRLHRANPTWGANRIAHAIGRSDAYVRATAQRHHLTLPRSRYAEVPTHGAAYSAKRRATLASYGALLEALQALVTAVTFADPPKLFNDVLCHEARVPVEFVNAARAAISRALPGGEGK